ncbi:DUF4270 domain-containing protein [Bacteroidales bacterium]|nr:DUF4270 domain-containing protein [Bacteroidales bacterium]
MTKLLVSTKYPAILLALLIVFNSCEDPDSELGKNIIPSTSMYNTYYKEFDIQSSIFVNPDKSINTGMATRFYIGEVEDPYFGNTKSSAALEFLQLDNFIGTADSIKPMVDSIYMLINYDYWGISKQFDNDNAEQSFDIYELKSDLPEEDKLYHNTEIDTAALIGHFTIEYDSGDGYIEVPLDKSFANSLYTKFNVNGTTLYKDNNPDYSAFKQHFKGIYITPSTTNELSNKRLMINVNLGSTVIILPYKTDSSDSTYYKKYFFHIDKSTSDTSLSGYSFDSLKTVVLYDFIHNTKEQNANDSLLYIGGFGRTMSKLSFNGLYSFLKDSLNSIQSFTGAELSLQAYKGDKNQQFYSTPKIALKGLYNFNDTTIRINLYDPVKMQIGKLEKEYDANSNSYDFSMKDYFNSLLIGDLDSITQDFCLFNSYNYEPSRFLPSRIMLKKEDEDGNKAKLKVYYIKKELN